MDAMKMVTGVCDGWGTHHPRGKAQTNPFGAYGKPHPSGCGFLAYDFFCCGNINAKS